MSKIVWFLLAGCCLIGRLSAQDVTFKKEVSWEIAPSFLVGQQATNPGWLEPTGPVDGHFKLTAYYKYPAVFTVQFDTVEGRATHLQIAIDELISEQQALAYAYFLGPFEQGDSLPSELVDSTAITNAIHAKIVAQFLELDEGMAYVQPDFSHDEVKGRIMKQALKQGEILTKDPWNRSARLQRGYLNYKLGKWEACITDFTWYIDSLRPDVLSKNIVNIADQDITDSMMVSQLEAQNSEWLSRSNTLNGRLQESTGYVAYFRGMSHARLGNNEKALKDLEVALNHTLYAGIVAMNIARLYYANSDMTNATKYVQLAADSSQHWQVLYDAARFFTQQRRPDLAIPLFNRALSELEADGELKSNNPALYYLNAAKIIRRQGDVKTAELHLKKSISANPNLAEAYYELGLIRVKQGHKNDACLLYGKSKFSGYTPDAFESEEFPCP